MAGARHLPFPPFPVALERLFTGDRSPGYREELWHPGLASSSRLPGSPPPSPRASESQARGRLQPCQSRPQPPSSRDRPGRPLGPRKRRTRDSPVLCRTSKSACLAESPHLNTSPQPAVATCKNELSTIITALRVNGLFLPLCFHSGQPASSSRPSLKISFFSIS